MAAQHFGGGQGALVIAQGQQAAGMTGAEAAVMEIVLRGGRKLEQAQGIGDGRAALAQAGGQGLLRQLEGLAQLLQGLGLFHGIEVFALQVLDKGGGHDFGIAHLAHMHGHPPEARLTGGPPAAFTGHDLVVAGPVGQGAHQQGLDDALFADGGRQFGQGFGVEGLAGLAGIGMQMGQGQQGGAVFRARLFFRRIVLFLPGGAHIRTAQQGVQAAAETFATHALSLTSCRAGGTFYDSDCPKPFDQRKPCPTSIFCT